MGAYSPAPVLTAELEARAMREIVEPTARAMAEAGTPFSGVLYAGLMLTADGPKLIEYNVRFGDPECEAIMPRIEGDFAALLIAVASGAGFEAPELERAIDHDGDRRRRGLSRRPRAAAAQIDGIEAAERVEGVTVFHAGTARHGSGALLASGGRVLAVTAHRRHARQRPRPRLSRHRRDRLADGFHRRDIGWRELERAS